jgi:hypothetical protein
MEPNYRKRFRQPKVDESLRGVKDASLGFSLLDI